MTEQELNLEKPKNVVLAVQFLWVALAINLINTALNWNIINAAASAQFPPNFPLSFTAFALIIHVITIAIVVWLYLKISSGRNWARILFTILTIIGVPLSIPNLLMYFDISKFMFFLQLISLLLNIAALCLLFTQPASVWYKNLKTLRKQKTA